MTEYNHTNLAFKTEDIVMPEAAAGIVDLPLDAAFLDVAANAQVPASEGPERAASISDALIACIRDTGRVYMGRIAESAGVTAEEAIKALRGAVYCNPDRWTGKPDTGWETADEYLSGNLRHKLLKARLAYKTYGGVFSDNVEALEKLLPPEVKAEDIYVTLGSPWLPPTVIDEFVDHLVQPLDYDVCRGTRHDEETGSWEIPLKSRYSRYVRCTSTFGTGRIDAVHILEKTLNMKTIQVTDEVSSTESKSGKKRVINREETAAAQEKQKLIIDEFRRWVWQDASRSEYVRKVFENRYCCNVARHFDGRFLEFPGMSPEVKLFPYQKDAVARILFTPNTLLAHDVGAGKTYIMAAAAMELRRMRMADKCLFVVPNNLTQQWQSMFLSLYPDAKLMVVEPKDMVPSSFNKTMLKIRDGSFDSIIMAYSCFDRIPLSKQAQVEALREERDAMMDKLGKKNRRVTSGFNRKLEKVKKDLGKMAASKDPANDLICFNDLGIDRLFVDEAHNYKNIAIETGIHGVYGISSSGSAKCKGMMDKVHYVQRTHKGGGVVMATGTPITNSISDIYVFQKYLQAGELDILGLQTFDSWAGMFAEKTTEFEIAVDTGSYRLATRFTNFHNIPELTTILASIADFHSMSDSTEIPDFDGYTDVVIPRSDALKAYLEEISERADRVHERRVKRDEDNMLKITSDGRKAALDIRLVTGPEEGSPEDSAPQYGLPVGRCKVSECAERAAAIWHRTKADRLTQLVFCDTSTPKAGFNIYDDLRQRLIDLGVDAGEIAYIHDASTEAKRSKLFRSMREGKVRILIGSTFKLGLGVNVQDRLVAVHHLDLPWRPADMVQREGRMLRAGNMNEKVEIYRYITEGSFDAYSWQLLETKQRFITDILSGTSSGRSGGEVDDTVLDYAEVKALALGNPLLRSRVETQNQISRLSILQRRSIEERLRLEQRYAEIPDAIAAKELELEMCLADCSYIAEEGTDPYKGNDTVAKQAAARWRQYIRWYLGQHLYAYVMKPKEQSLTQYRGFNIVLPAGMDADHPYIYLVREGRYRVDMGDKESGLLIRVDNYLDRLSEHAGVIRQQKELLEEELRATEEELSKSANYAELIEEYTAKLNEIDEELGVSELRKDKK